MAGEIGGIVCRADVTSDAEVEAGFAHSRESIGQERILVNADGYFNGASVRLDGAIRLAPR